MTDLCLAFTDFPEEYIYRQVGTFAEDYVYGLASGLWSGEDEHNVLYEMIIKMNDFDQDSFELIKLTKLLVDLFEGERSRIFLSIENLLFYLEIGFDELYELVNILVAHEIVSVYERNPIENEETYELDFNRIEYSYFIGLS